MVQWLGLCAFTAKGEGLIPGRGTKNPTKLEAGSKKNKQKNPYSSPTTGQLNPNLNGWGLNNCIFKKFPT